jgi:hypothetical protein
MLVTLAAVLASGAPTSPVERWRDTIDRTAARVGVPAEWIANVMRAESNGQAVVHGRGIRSAKGAIGLMQIMPATWKMLRAAHHLGPDPDNPDDNVMAGATYLRTLYERFGYPALFAAYHAGPARYQAFLSGRVGLPSATMVYTRLVLVGLDGGSRRTAELRAGRDAVLPSTPQPTLFVGLSGPANSSTDDDGSGEGAPSIGSSCKRGLGIWAVPPSCGEARPARAP